MVIANKLGANPSWDGGAQSKEAREQAFVLGFEEVGISDISLVGGKNASLGEMIGQLTAQGVNVPTGFATTAYAFRYFMQRAGLTQKLRDLLADLDVNTIQDLQERGRQARLLIFHTPFPPELEQAITTAYFRLCERYGIQLGTCDRPDVLAPQQKIYRMPALLDSRKLISIFTAFGRCWKPVTVAMLRYLPIALFLTAPFKALII
jgi:pyruvate, water dikinase